MIPDLTVEYSDFSFTFSLYSYFIRVRPFVIYRGEYYGLQQILNYLQAQYPQVTYSWLKQKALYSIHYGFNLTMLPQSVADNLDYVGFRLQDLNFPLSWFSLEIQERWDEYGLPYNVTLIHIPRARLTLSFEDLLPWGYTVTHVNSTWVLVGGVRGHTDLILDPITYSWPDITVTGYSEGSECDYGDIYDEDQAQGWGVFYMTSTAEYRVFDSYVLLKIGDGSTETWFAAESCSIKFHSFHSGLVDLITVRNNAHFRHGKISNSTLKTGTNGVYMMGWADQVIVEAGGEAQIYGSMFTHIGDTGGDVYGVAGNLTIWDSILTDCSLYPTPTGSDRYYRITIKDGALGCFLQGDLEDILIHSCTYAIRTYGSTDRNITGLISRDNSYLVSVIPGSSGSRYIKNVDADSWSFYHLVPTTVEFYRAYDYDLTVTWANNSLIENCEIWLTYYGQGGGQSYHGYTNSSGQIPTQEVLIEHYNYTGGDTPYSYGPFRLRLKKGEVEYLQNFTHPGEAMDLIIALQSPEEAPSQGPYFSAHRIDYGSFSLGIQAPKEIHPSFHQYLSNSVPIHIDLRLDNYQIGSRDFLLSYELWDLEAGELRLNGSSLLNVGAGGYETVALDLTEPFSKTEDPRNYTLSVTVEVGRKKYQPILWPLTLSHTTWGPLIYTSALLGMLVAMVSIAYGVHQYWPKIRGEKTYG